MAENQQVINLGSVQSPYLEQRLTIPAGAAPKFDYSYDCFNLLYASVPDVLEVTFGGAAVQSKFASGMHFKLNEPVSYIQFFNNSNQPIDIWYALAIGEIKDNRLNVSGTIETKQKSFDTFTAETQTISGGSVTITTTGQTVIQNTGANTMYIGGTGTDGLKLEPNGSFDFNYTGNITIYGTDNDTLAIGSFN